MTRKQLVVVVLIVVAASTLSAVVAYRRALRVQQTAPIATGKTTTGCVDFREAGSHTGEVGCVSGRVLRVYTSRAGNTFLDFCADYRNCPFTTVIFADDHKKFGNLQTLAGRALEIQGAITVYEGKAEIIIRDPSQIHEVQ